MTPITAMVTTGALACAIGIWQRNEAVQQQVRLGQFLMNTLLGWVQDPDLYYEVDHEKAKEKFINRYISLG